MDSIVLGTRWWNVPVVFFVIIDGSDYMNNDNHDNDNNNNDNMMNEKYLMTCICFELIHIGQ